MTNNQFKTTARIITHQEWKEIADMLYNVRKAYNEPNREDEERLKNMEMYLQCGLAACDRVRKRWVLNG